MIDICSKFELINPIKKPNKAKVKATSTSKKIISNGYLTVTSTKNNVIVDQEEQERDREEYQSVLGDLELESPTLAPQAPIPPNTGQVTSQQVAGLFPNDPLSIEIARRRQSG